MSSTTCYELIQALIDDELHDKRNEEGNVGTYYNFMLYTMRKVFKTRFMVGHYFIVILLNCDIRFI